MATRSFSPPLHALAEAALGLAFPALCLACGRRLPVDAGAVPVCGPCASRLPQASEAVLTERLAALPEAAGVFGRATGLWVFDAGGTVQRLQHRLKYGNAPGLATALGRRLGRALGETAPEDSYDAIVPIPLARTRRLERGYNQSQHLAEGIAAWLGRPETCRPDVLVRVRATRSQTALSRSKRWANVSGAFQVRTETDLGRKRVLLVDDVLTTGATLTAAAHALCGAGASVDLAVFAVAAV